MDPHLEFVAINLDNPQGPKYFSQVGNFIAEKELNWFSHSRRKCLGVHMVIFGKVFSLSKVLEICS